MPRHQLSIQWTLGPIYGAISQGIDLGWQKLETAVTLFRYAGTGKTLD